MTTTKAFDNLNRLTSIANVGVSSGNYTPNTLNQNTSRRAPNTVDVICVASSSASVTVNSQAASEGQEMSGCWVTRAAGCALGPLYGFWQRW